MARLLGPDNGQRLVYVLSGSLLRSAAGYTAVFYTDAAGTILANIATFDGTMTPGAVIAGSTLQVDSTSRLPRFWFPDGVPFGLDTIYVRVGGVSSPVVMLNADYDYRLDNLSGGGGVTSVNGDVGPIVVLDAAEVGADAAGTAAAAVSAHDADTTNVHGIANTAVLATATDITTAVNAALADTTNVHGITDTSVLATATDVATAVSNALADTTNVHGITDTSLLATKLIVRKARITSGDYAVPNTAGAWALAAGFTVVLPAIVGDYVELSFSMMHNLTGSNYLDWTVNVSAAIARAASSDTATPGVEGLPSLYPGAGTFRTAASAWGFVVEAGHLSAGNVTFQLANKTAGAGTVYRSATYPLVLIARNYGPVNFA